MHETVIKLYAEPVLLIDHKRSQKPGGFPMRRNRVLTLRAKF